MSRQQHDLLNDHFGIASTDQLGTDAGTEGWTLHDNGDGTASWSAGGDGSITVGDGGSPVTGVDTVIFDGATVTDDTGGQVTVTVTGGGGQFISDPDDNALVFATGFNQIVNEAYDPDADDAGYMGVTAGSANIGSDTAGGESYLSSNGPDLSIIANVGTIALISTTLTLPYASLPTSDPGVLGQVYQLAGVLMVSAGP